MNRCLTLFAIVIPALLSHAATTMTLSPPTARSGDTVTATIRGTWPNSCVPEKPSVTSAGRTVRIEARVNAGICAAVLTDYTLTATFTAPATEKAGPFTVEYSVTDTNEHYLEATAQLMLTSGFCVFADSLTVSDSVSLSWCNPSTLVPDNSFTVNSYRIYSSKSANGPFALVKEVQGATNTSTTVAASAGTNYFYVEAKGCTFTIAGACIDTTQLTKIASAFVTTSAGCSENSTTLCLNSGRFEVAARWRTADGNNGSARAVALTNDSGYFWFFNQDNVEVTVKVLDACASNQNFWVFASGMTNVGVDFTVFDTLTKKSKKYTNVMGKEFAPVLDTAAFSCK